MSSGDEEKRRWEQVSQLRSLSVGHFISKLPSFQSRKRLCICLAGVDATETETEAIAVETAVGVLNEVVTKRGVEAEQIDILLCGPACSEYGERRQDGAVCVKDLRNKQSDQKEVEMRMLTRCGYYHDLLSSEYTRSLCEGALVICFNAGMWGYESWEESVAAMAELNNTIVVTSYNLYESEEDFDCVEKWLEGKGMKMVWDCEEAEHRGDKRKGRIAPYHDMADSW
eukprot:CAMPEP_0113887420 /NCGR_PEP_ID=MMETSP0780_2-20120614/12204_1 /TAXON_ID=652834 /ORGANISM="Palpitomonas bilix" /LENGTH=226 /DNA_ID=CAMNT_0000875951 /DNA_START=67 /DNA_END=744 /DNA_ORIENTATION=+ /assembly_acc=CAM_ASM_000599